MHKIELTEWEREGLELQRLPIGKPSQLSDTFRAGVQFATRKSNETIEQKTQLHTLILFYHLTGS